MHIHPRWLTFAPSPLTKVHWPSTPSLSYEIDVWGVKIAREEREKWGKEEKIDRLINRQTSR